MTTHTLVLYLVLLLVIVPSPGPAVFFAITNSMLYGWKKAIYAPLGNITGLLCLGIISISGLGTLLIASQFAFTIVKYIGAAYLVFLGVKMIINKTSAVGEQVEGFSIEETSRRKIFLKAFAVAISNPKAVVLLTALFPQFIDPNASLIPQFSILIIILLIFSFCSLTSYILLAHQVKQWLNNARRIRIFNWISGSVFIGFGVLLARSTNK